VHSAACDFEKLDRCAPWHEWCCAHDRSMTEREAKSRAVKILAKSIYRDLEAQGFDEKQIVALATELISEVTNKISSRDSVAKHA
jgi:hypothetical protein